MSSFIYQKMPQEISAMAAGDKPPFSPRKHRAKIVDGLIVPFSNAFKLICGSYEMWDYWEDIDGLDLLFPITIDFGEVLEIWPPELSQASSSNDTFQLIIHWAVKDDSGIDITDDFALQVVEAPNLRNYELINTCGISRDVGEFIVYGMYY